MQCGLLYLLTEKVCQSSKEVCEMQSKWQGCLLQDIDFVMLQDFDSVAPFYCLAKRFVACWLCWQSLELMKNRDDKTAMVG